jgi:cell wall-associated NlpC family hydrolase
MAKAVEPVRTSNLHEGDLVFFAFNGSKVINHVGIYLHNNKFFHASTTRGAIISDLKDPWYSNYLVKAGSLPAYRAGAK